jgi:hypothetical protein
VRKTLKKCESDLHFSTRLQKFLSANERNSTDEKCNNTLNENSDITLATSGRLEWITAKLVVEERDE